MTSKYFDVAVIGGGMVGAATALGLAQAGFSVLVVESRQPKPFAQDSAPELRISAVSAMSVALLDELGVWDTVMQMRAVPYRRLETWEWEQAKVSFTAQSLGIDTLGYMLENEVLQLALWQKMEQMPGITLQTPDSLAGLQRADDKWQLSFLQGDTVSAQLVLGADGANSQVRALSGIGISGWGYRQSCLLVSVQTDREQQDITWQQFTPQGPRAFLPLWDNWASLAWYDHADRVKQLMALPLPQLTDEIKVNFPACLGDVTARAAASFPLTRCHAHGYIQPGLALLGDAAHTINPLAGQGVNLGYRDVKALLKVVIEARRHGESWWSEEVLRRYQRSRYPDNLAMQSGMDLFYTVFSNDIVPVKLLRNLGLRVAQRSGIVKRQALKYALGL